MESESEIDFNNVREEADKKLRHSYIDYSECNFTDLFNSNDITADKDSNNSDKESDSESNESVNEEVVLSKKKMAEKKMQNLQSQNLNQN